MRVPRFELSLRGEMDVTRRPGLQHRRLHPQPVRGFRIDNTDHIIDVNKGNIPFEYDQVNIICPVYRTGTQEEDVERYIIYNVSKEEYDSCRITNPTPRIIAVCDRPHQLMYFTITFRSFTPQPGGLEFRPGQDYYFISTSTGSVEGLHQRIGGRCATHNMKVIFKVCCDPSKSTTTSRPRSTTTSTALPPAVPSSVPRDELASDRRRPWVTNGTRPVLPAGPAARPRAPWLPPTAVPDESPLPPPRRWPVFPPRPPPHRPIKTYDVPVADGKQSSKKTAENRDKLPNETRAKNEELVNSASSLVSLCSRLVELARASPSPWRREWNLPVRFRESLHSDSGARSKRER
ncbi:hypothetical protein HPB50_026671 [Hyalomma asiaticum]|uniref:Uncharacterized protein n=1 Tax=Hyalomma asiaticum TaxID=266040 RepID=A0ACB7T775_HYAAI|nr:hypothetical protein HPB50_026671 [Hyalomma asiaticum]